MKNLVINIEPIYSFMRVNKLTKQKMATLCDINYSSLLKILNQDLNFRLEALYKVAKIMKIDLRLLFIYETKNQIIHQE